MSVELREITRENWLECARLQVSDEQQVFVEPNSLLMLQAKFEPYWRPLAIYGDDQLVGFIMYSETPVPTTHEHWILQLMIDHDIQGKGYGRAAMEQVLSLLLAKPDCQEVWLSCHPENVIALRMYSNLGFVVTDRTLDGEICLCHQGSMDLEP